MEKVKGIKVFFAKLCVHCGFAVSFASQIEETKATSELLT